MFGFFKKKTVQQKSTTEEPVLSATEIEALQQELSELQSNLTKVAPTDKETLANQYEQIGLKQAELGQQDEAIKALEQSLDLKQSIGDGYKKLMSLYNQKRAAAARKGDDQGIDYYMGKMDEMRQIAKKVTIAGK